MLKKSLIILFAGLLLAACAKVAFTGRSQAKLLPDSEINAMSFAEYDNFLSQNPPMRSGQEVEMVKRIGNDIRLAAEVYYKANGLEAELSNFEWEFNVVDEPTINAFCMPGGKVIVYTGIITLAQNEDALATIMGHEIAHALAHHGNERMTQQMIAQLGISSLEIALQNEPTQTRSMLMTAAGLGTQVGVLLPFSRKHESEADEIGLHLMTMAGYDPTAAVPFWERMASQGGERPPEFLSTHPDPSNRSQRLQELVPKSREYAAKYPVPGSSRNQ